MLKKSTVDRYLKHWGMDWRRLRREPPAVRFQAEQSNELWQFDISPSDLKHLKSPAWVDKAKGQPTLMKCVRFSVGTCHPGGRQSYTSCCWPPVCR